MVVPYRRWALLAVILAAVAAVDAYYWFACALPPTRLDERAAAVWRRDEFLSSLFGPLAWVWPTFSWLRNWEVAIVAAAIASPVAIAVMRPGRIVLTLGVIAIIMWVFIGWLMCCGRPV